MIFGDKAQTVTPTGGVWVIALRLAVTLGFAVHGIAELAGAPMMVTTFETLGVGQWLRYLTGLIEIGGALLLSTRFRTIGAASLCATAVCAVGAHVLVVDGMVLPALILALLSGSLLYFMSKTMRREAALGS